MKTIPIRHITAVPKGKIDTGRFSIRDLQQVLNGRDLVHDLHRHDFYFLLAVQKGQGVHEIDFVEYEVGDNAVFILRPGQVHKLQLKAESTGFLLEFDRTFYQPKNSITDQRWKKASSRNYCAVTAERFAKLHAFLSAVFNEFATQHDGYSEAIRANLDLFFIEYTRQSQHPNSMAATDNGYALERFEDLIRLLEANIGSLKNVAQYAELLRLSAFQLNAITKGVVGKTVSELINDQILLEAKRYLLATSKPIKEVADQLGYEDVSYFIRFFKKHTGHSPEAFRKNFK